MTCKNKCRDCDCGVFLELNIENIVTSLHDIGDFSKFGLRGHLEHYRATMTEDRVSCGFRRKMKGVPIEGSGKTLEICAKGGFCEISVEIGGEKFISKANAPKNKPFNLPVGRQEREKINKFLRN